MENPENRKILVTTALPYANGSIHIGHMLEHFITDFWTRFQKMRGHDCISICGADTHGAPIMLNARKRGVSPEALTSEFRSEHVEDFRSFGVVYDSYGSTHDPENQTLCEQVYLKLKDAGDIVEKTVSQLYCDHDKMFLPDRFVKGTCPKCGATDQYGDQCEVCSAVYDPADLVEPACALCGNKPHPRESTHLYFRIENHREFLKDWVPEHNDPAVSKKLLEWFEEGELRDWCISRDEPYFGFKIPGTENKYFYVWMDAPLGYISATTKGLGDERGNGFWKDPSAEIYHNIGKDIIYFHSLFWPAVLKRSGYQTPSKVWVHGMLTVGGEKLSKSRGTFINAKTFAKHLDPEYLRYYMAAKIGPGIGDIDFSFDDFVTRVNSDLVGKITNVASRGAQMLQKKLDGVVGSVDDQGMELIEKGRKLGEQVADAMENREFSKAVVYIRDIADLANKYFDENEPWKLIKTDPSKTKTILTNILNLFRLCAVYLQPIMPEYSRRARALFEGGEGDFSWKDADTLFELKKLQPFTHLLTRVDGKKVEAIVTETKEEVAALADHNTDKNLEAAESQEPLQEEISIDDFSKLDLRVAKVESAESVKGASKLLQLKLDVGSLGKRQVFSGIKKFYKPEDLIGKHVVLVANLKPRKMKFGLSEGMVLAAASESGLWVMEASNEAPAGTRIS